jgi:hypothetical protein
MVTALMPAPTPHIYLEESAILAPLVVSIATSTPAYLVSSIVNSITIVVILTAT